MIQLGTTHVMYRPVVIALISVPAGSVVQNTPPYIVALSQSVLKAKFFLGVVPLDAWAVVIWLDRQK